MAWADPFLPALHLVALPPACSPPGPAWVPRHTIRLGLTAHLLAPLPSPAPPPCLQPALYLPHSAIRSMELMRAGGTSSTFDLVVHLCGGGVQEFGMVPREEAAGIEGG